jgi:hypothetical protein
MATPRRQAWQQSHLVIAVVDKIGLNSIGQYD